MNIKFKIIKIVRYKSVTKTCPHCNGEAVFFDNLLLQFECLECDYMWKECDDICFDISMN